MGRNFGKKHQNPTLVAIYYIFHPRFQTNFPSRTPISCFCMILGNMVVASGFYQHTSQTDIPTIFKFGVATSFIIFPVILVLSYIVNRPSRRYKVLAYIFEGAFCIMAAALAVIYTIQFSSVKGYAWLYSVIVATIQDCIVNQPIKIIALSTWTAIKHKMSKFVVTC